MFFFNNSDRFDFFDRTISGWSAERFDRFDDSNSFGRYNCFDRFRRPEFVIVVLGKIKKETRIYEERSKLVIV